MVSAGIAVWVIRVRSTLPAEMICASPTRAARTWSWLRRARCRSVAVTRSGGTSVPPGNDQAPSGVRSDRPGRPARLAWASGTAPRRSWRPGGARVRALSQGRRPTAPRAGPSARRPGPLHDVDGQGPPPGEAAELIEQQHRRSASLPTSGADVLGVGGGEHPHGRVAVLEVVEDGRVKMATSTSSSHQSPSQAGPRLAAKFEARQGDIAQAAPSSAL
jgi:hypothetical protein